MAEAKAEEEAKEKADAKKEYDVELTAYLKITFGEDLKRLANIAFILDDTEYQKKINAIHLNQEIDSEEKKETYKTNISELRELFFDYQTLLKMSKSYSDKFSERLGESINVKKIRKDIVTVVSNEELELKQKPSNNTSLQNATNELKVLYHNIKSNMNLTNAKKVAPAVAFGTFLGSLVIGGLAFFITINFTAGIVIYGLMTSALVASTVQRAVNLIKELPNMDRSCLPEESLKNVTIEEVNQPSQEQGQSNEKINAVETARSQKVNIESTQGLEKSAVDSMISEEKTSQYSSSKAAEQQGESKSSLELTSLEPRTNNPLLDNDSKIISAKNEEIPEKNKAESKDNNNEAKQPDNWTKQAKPNDITTQVNI